MGREARREEISERGGEGEEGEGVGWERKGWEGEEGGVQKGTERMG